MTMSLPQLLASGRLRHLPAALSEIEDLLRVVERDLADACIEDVSADRRFATAYNAALQLATVALRAEGYRTSGTAHHYTTIAALPLILGAGATQTADYLDACRMRRNTVDYDGVGIATERDVAELVLEATALRESVLGWLARAHPELMPARRPYEDRLHRRTRSPRTDPPREDDRP